MCSVYKSAAPQPNSVNAAEAASVRSRFAQRGHSWLHAQEQIEGHQRCDSQGIDRLNVMLCFIPAVVSQSGRREAGTTFRAAHTQTHLKGIIHRIWVVITCGRATQLQQHIVWQSAGSSSGGGGEVGPARRASVAQPVEFRPAGV